MSFRGASYRRRNIVWITRQIWAQTLLGTLLNLSDFTFFTSELKTPILTTWDSVRMELYEAMQKNT